MNSLWQLALCVFLLVVAASLVVSTWRTSETAGTIDRLSLLAHCVMLVALVSFARTHVWWSAIPLVFWFLAVATASAAVLGAVLRWPDLPWLRETKRARRVVDSGLTLAVGVVVTVALALS